MNADKLHLWEKAPIIGLFLAQGLYVWRWYVGDAMTPPPEVIAAAGMAAVAAIDGAMVATVAGMRQGRRSRASVAAIVVTAAFGAAVALDLYGAITLVSAWLHAGFALTIVCYLLHLAAPVAARATRRAGTRGRRRLVRRLVAALRTERATLAQARAAAAQAWADAGTQAVEAGAAVARERERAAQLSHDLAQARRDLAQAQQAAAQAVPADDEQWITYNGQRYTLAQLVEATGTSSGTLRRKLAQASGMTAQAAD